MADVLSWNMSGHGPMSMSLAAMKALAIASGFVLPNSNGTHPNSRPRADLQRMRMRDVYSTHHTH